MPLADLPPAVIETRSPDRAEEPEAFDLAALARPADPVPLRIIRPRCEPAASNEIVVCAPDPQRERLTPGAGAQGPAPALPPATFDLGGGMSLDVRAQSVDLPGAGGGRAMVDLRIHF